MAHRTNSETASRIQNAARAGGPPNGGEAQRFLEVFMDQNNLCNLRCTMCAFSDPRVAQLGKHQMPLWLFEKIAREVFQHASYLTLSCLTDIEDVGYLRQTPEEIVLFESGRKVICKRPWNTAAIHFNGDVLICTTWMREPVGNLARQSFDEIWSGEPLAALRREFEQHQPGLDCQHCKIKMQPDEVEDGFFRMLQKSPAPVEPGPRSGAGEGRVAPRGR